MASVEISNFSYGDLNRVNSQLTSEDCVEAHLCKLLMDCISAEGRGHDPVAARAFRECRATLQAALLHVLANKGWDMHLLRAPVWTTKDEPLTHWPAKNI
jgi:hypothetical protein